LLVLVDMCSNRRVPIVVDGHLVIRKDKNIVT
jgi:hypothetical protein